MNQVLFDKPTSNTNMVNKMCDTQIWPGDAPNPDIMTWKTTH